MITTVNYIWRGVKLKKMKMRPSVGHRSIKHGFSRVKMNAVVMIGEWISVEGVIKGSIIAIEGVMICEAFFSQYCTYNSLLHPYNDLIKKALIFIY